MSFHTLPLVLCLHLKRFDHSGILRNNNAGGGAGGGGGTKIETFVRFPLQDLDMSPYLFRNTNNDTNGSSSSSANTAASPPLLTPTISSKDARYDLFCVIVHKGTLDTGHYICYLRTSHEWFRCDDRHIIKVDPTEVMNCSAYLLFYMRNQIKLPS